MPDITISWIAAVLGLVVAIVLVLKEFSPVCPLFFDAIVGCLTGGAFLSDTIAVLLNGTQNIMGATIRILAAGMLAGVMMESGTVGSTANAIVQKLGEKKTILSLALSATVVTAVGISIPVAVLIVAPIALSVRKGTGVNKLSLLITLSSGGKAGSIISPNPNTITAASGFDLPLSGVMITDFIPAIFGLITAAVLTNIMRNKGLMVKETDLIEEQAKELLPLKKALIAPVLAIVLLLLNPIGAVLNISFIRSLNIDALYILPFASVVGTIAVGQTKQLAFYTSPGLKRVTSTVLILIGAGAIAGLISVPGLSTQTIHLISVIGISGAFLAPVSGTLIGLAVGSTSTAVISATGSFGPAILDIGTSSLPAAVVVHASATVIDSVPQGNYFRITAQSINMTIKGRIRMIPYEICVSGVMTIVATILYGFILNQLESRREKMTKKSVLAPGSFKENMSTEEARLTMGEGILAVFKDADIQHVPMADSGEGAVDSLVDTTGDTRVPVRVAGPLPDQIVETCYGLLGDQETVVIEMAKTNGIELVKAAERNPLVTSTYSIGKMIQHTFGHGAKKIIIGVDGSVTNGGGTSMIQALGVRLLDKEG